MDYRPTGKNYRRYLKGELLSEFSPEQYAQWRQTVPFSDAQIARAFLKLAHDIKHENEFMFKKYRRAAQVALTGRVGSHLLGVALGELIKFCRVCGKPALYRCGNEGRCRKHRTLINTPVKEKYQRLNNSHQPLELERVERDTEDLKNEHLRRLKSKNRNRR